MAPSSAPCRSTRRRSAWCASPPRTCGSRARSRRSSSARSKPSRSPSRPPATRASPSRRRPESPRARDPIPSPCDARPAVAEVVLGIETSCDETSAAVLVGERRRPELASLVILSQDVHQVFGGRVPELASRAHLAALPAVAERALAEAGVSWSAVDADAVTQGPGLVGALLVSGGHTLLLDVPAWGRYRLLGQTRDDAAGEAFDKVATLLGLGYPGGPEIEKLACEEGGDPTRFNFPRPMIADGFGFSFSGLKTAVLHAVRASANL